MDDVGTDGPLDAAALREQQRRSAERIQQFQQRALSARSEFAAAQATATSTDRAVRVTAGPGGVLLDLHLEPAAAKLATATLAASILQTYQEAARAAAAEGRRLLAGLVGDDSALLAALDVAAPSITPEPRS